MERLWQSMDEGRDRQFPRGSPLTPYAWAVALTGLAVLVRIGLERSAGVHVTFLLFVPAILAAARTGGLWPGIAATAAGGFCAVTFLATSGLSPDNFIDAGLFSALGVAIALGGRHVVTMQAAAAETNRHLIEREAHLKSILATVPEGMMVIDEHGVLQSFSQAAEIQFGWTAAELLGKNICILMPPHDRSHHDEYLDHYARTGERRVIGRGRTVSAMRKDGSTFPVELAVGEMRSGERVFFTGFTRDLSRRVEAEERLQALQTELIHVSRHSAMGEMATTLAHELNQPLSAMSNYLKGGRRLLEGENPASQAIEPMTKAAEQSLRAGEIIRRLRDFVTRGESELRPEPIGPLVHEAAALALMGSRGTGVNIRYALRADQEEVLADRIQLQQVILNLVRNAVEAMDGHSPKDLLLTSSVKSEGLVQVTVSDTGPGLSPHVAERLFQPFVTTKGPQGMGVGLSICKTIIEAHGGRIWAEAGSDGGTMFGFTVPRAHRDAS